MIALPDLTAARPLLRKLRPTQSVLIEHVCQEDQVVLRAEGFVVLPAPWVGGWVIRGYQ